MIENWGKTQLGSALVVLTFAAGSACDEPRHDAAADPYDNEFGVLLGGLGAEITDCTNAGPALSGSTLTLGLASGDDAVISVEGGKLKVNGHTCLKDDVSATPLTPSNVTKLVVNGTSSGANSVLIDLLPGPFGNIFGPAGGITINADNGGAVSVGVRGTETSNRFKMAQAASGSDLFFELNGNAQADVRVVGDPSSVVVALGGGADTFTAQGSQSLTFQGSAIPMRGVVSEPLTVYGGAGADILDGGNGDDILDGGADNDTFLTTAAGHDGADTFQGGAGIDTADYSNRTTGVTVDIDPGHTNPFVEGASLYGKTLSPGLALSLSVGASGTITYSSSGQVGISNILTELNQVGAFAAVASASADDRGRLVIEANTDSATVVILSDNQLLIGGTQPSTPSRSNSPGDLADADDGETGADEHDDVKSDIENIRGGVADDVLTGSVLGNSITGNAGADNISGGPGGNCLSDVDTLTGGAGDDVFQMGALPNCGDAIDGGAGRDSANYELRAGAVTVSIDGAANDGSAEKDNVKTSIEVVLGGDGDDDIKGGTSNDELHGGPGNDLLRGGTGNDTLAGGPGSDQLLGEAGDDYFDEASVAAPHYGILLSAFGGQDSLHGGAGANTCDFRRGSAAAATYTLCFSATTANCPPAANDGVDADDLTNCNHVLLDDGADTVTGSDSNDIIEGGGGSDSIDGGPGNDTLFGEAGDDALFGGAGDDTLDGGPDQTLAGDGGPGTDICLSPNTGTACEL